MGVMKVACQKGKWLQNLLKMRSWEPQENALRMKKKVKCRPDRIPDTRYPRKVERRPDRIPDVRYPGGMTVEKNSGCEMSGWNVSGKEFRM